MAENTPEISTLEDLRAFVQRTICDQQQLLSDTIRLSEQILLRQGKPCGMQFTLNGPRAVTFLAIWDAVGQTVLFYDSNGARSHRYELTTTAELERELAALAGTKAE
jgi:hypothetical protein